MNCIPKVIESDLLSDLMGNWGTSVDRVVAAVSDHSSAWEIGQATQTAPAHRQCPCRALALHAPGRVCGCPATVRLNFRHGYLCSLGCWLCDTDELPQREYYATVERIRRTLTGAVGAPTIMRHPHREDEVTYLWAGETAHVQLLSDHAHDRTITVIANDPWICPWCNVH